MSIGITIDPTKAELSRIAADHVAAFLAKGGKIQEKADGESGIKSGDMQSIQDRNWQVAREKEKSGYVHRPDPVKRKRK